jgi:hypothetical protein
VLIILIFQVALALAVSSTTYSINAVIRKKIVVVVLVLEVGDENAGNQVQVLELMPLMQIVVSWTKMNVHKGTNNAARFGMSTISSRVVRTSCAKTSSTLMVAKTQVVSLMTRCSVVATRSYNAVVLTPTQTPMVQQCANGRLWEACVLKSGLQCCVTGSVEQFVILQLGVHS